ncbi:unnamed protein product [Effrenium voratum]|nr:unnamed protein product [Effrenium voratum]
MIVCPSAMGDLNHVELALVGWAVLHLALALSMSMFRITGNVPKKDKPLLEGERTESQRPLGELYFTKFHAVQLNVAEYSGIVMALMLYIDFRGRSREAGVSAFGGAAALITTVSKYLQVLFAILSPNVHKFDLKKAVMVTVAYVGIAMLIGDALTY